MKYFSLIRGDVVARGKGGKVLPAEAFSKLMDAEELLREVKEDAASYREQVAKEAEQLKELGELAGFEAGLEKWSAQIAKLEEEIARVREEITKAIIPVALQAARKIVGREMALNKETIVDIVATTLKAVTGHRRVVIYCNKDDVEQLKAKKPELEKSFERLESLAIQERGDIQQGGCVIETEAGIINAQPDQVWRSLEAAFEKILQES